MICDWKQKAMTYILHIIDNWMDGQTKEIIDTASLFENIALITKMNYSI